MKQQLIRIAKGMGRVLESVVTPGAAAMYWSMPVASVNHGDSFVGWEDLHGHTGIPLQS
jgi:hypothetical protein